MTHVGQHLLDCVPQALCHAVVRVQRESATKVLLGVLRVHHTSVQQRLVRQQRLLVLVEVKQIARRQQQRVADLLRDAHRLHGVGQRGEVDGQPGLSFADCGVVNGGGCELRLSRREEKHSQKRAVGFENAPHLLCLHYRAAVVQADLRGTPLSSDQVQIGLRAEDYASLHCMCDDPSRCPIQCAPRFPPQNR